MKYKRLTVEDVKSLMEEHDVFLQHSVYGFIKGSLYHNRGCAVSMLILRECGSVIEAGKVIGQGCTLAGYAKSIHFPVAYLYGLECGFDYPYYEATDEDFAQGYEDGQALRSLVGGDIS